MRASGLKKNPDNKNPEDYTVEPFQASSIPVEEGIFLSDRSLEVYTLPGHSPGHLVFFDPKTNIFYGNDIIHTGRGLYILIENSSIDDYIESLTELKSLHDAGAFDTLVTSRNEPLAGADLLLIDDLLVGLHEIATGDLEYEIIETTWDTARSYQIGSSEIPTKRYSQEKIREFTLENRERIYQSLQDCTIIVNKIPAPFDGSDKSRKASNLPDQHTQTVK